MLLQTVVAHCCCTSLFQTVFSVLVQIVAQQHCEIILWMEFLTQLFHFQSLREDRDLLLPANLLHRPEGGPDQGEDLRHKHLRPQPWLRRPRGLVQPHHPRPGRLQVRGPQGAGQGLLRTGPQGLRPQEAGVRRAQDDQERQEVREAGAQRAQDPRASSDGGFRGQRQRGPHEEQLHVQEPRLHRLRADVAQPVRVDQEEPVPEFRHLPGEELQPQHPAGPLDPVQGQDHPWRPQAGEHPPQAAWQVRP